MHAEARNYCLTRSWRLRRSRKHANTKIDIAVSLLGEGCTNRKHRETEREFVKAELTQHVRGTVGNPIVIWLLLNIVMPLVLKLVFKWWENRNR